jgi:hypothetical protein
VRLVLRILTFTALAAGIAVIGGVLLLGYGFYMSADFADTETARVASPNGTIEAVTVWRQGNVTVPDAILVYLVPTGRRPSGDPVIVAVDVGGLVIAWQDGATLLVHADEGDVRHHMDALTVNVNGKPTVIKIEPDFVKPLHGSPR